MSAALKIPGNNKFERVRENKLIHYAFLLFYCLHINWLFEVTVWK